MALGQQNTGPQQEVNKVAGATLQSSTYEDGREKYWGELAIEEKLERMRSLVKSLVVNIDEMRSKINRIGDHTHDENGKAIIQKPMREAMDVYVTPITRMGTRKETDQQYF